MSVPKTTRNRTATLIALALFIAIYTGGIGALYILNAIAGSAA